MKKSNFKRRMKLIYRRYRTCPKTGRVMDAFEYGHKGWPMWVPI